MVKRSLSLLKRVFVTIPKLSPTHTRCKIKQWTVPTNTDVTCYDPVIILKCTPDVISNGYRKYETHEPLMIVEAHDEGKLIIYEDFANAAGTGAEEDSSAWLDVGQVIGEIHDDDDDVAETNEWIWQAYTHDE